MATFTVKYESSCSGGEHIKLGVYRDGSKIKELVVLRSEMLNLDLDWREVLPIFLREVIKRSGAATLGQMRTAIEAASWVM